MKKHLLVDRINFLWEKSNRDPEGLKALEEYELNLLRALHSGSGEPEYDDLEDLLNIQRALNKLNILVADQIHEYFGDITPSKKFIMAGESNIMADLGLTDREIYHVGDKVIILDVKNELIGRLAVRREDLDEDYYGKNGRLPKESWEAILANDERIFVGRIFPFMDNYKANGPKFQKLPQWLTRAELKRGFIYEATFEDNRFTFILLGSQSPKRPYICLIDNNDPGFHNWQDEDLSKRIKKVLELNPDQLDDEFLCLLLGDEMHDEVIIYDNDIDPYVLAGAMGYVTKIIELSQFKPE